jgi:hypothetical protein
MDNEVILRIFIHHFNFTRLIPNVESIQIKIGQVFKHNEIDEYVIGENNANEYDYNYAEDNNGANKDEDNDANEDKDNNNNDEDDDNNVNENKDDDNNDNDANDDDNDADEDENSDVDKDEYHDDNEVKDGGDDDDNRFERDNEVEIDEFIWLKDSSSNCSENPSESSKGYGMELSNAYEDLNNKTELKQSL